MIPVKRDFADKAKATFIDEVDTSKLFNSPAFQLL